MNDILIVAHYTSIPTVNAIGRFNVIAERLAEKGYNVELVTSSFEHSTKKHLCELEHDIGKMSYTVTQIEEPGYKKNVSISRVISHKIMSRNLKKYLEKRKLPDIIYCSIPSTSVARETANFCNKNKILLIADVQDLWPEAFNMVLPFGRINEILTKKIQRDANYFYKTADEVIAVSKTYLSRALSVNKKTCKGHVVYLGTDIQRYEIAESNANLNLNDMKSDIIRVAYCGTLGHSYDIKCVIDAISILNNEHDIIFVVMGDGPLRDDFEQYSKQRNIEAVFTGMLAFENMVQQLKVCDIVVNPIIKESPASIINKHAIYAISGLPVLNTQESDEYIQMVSEEKMGLNSKSGDAYQLAGNLEYLIEHPDVRKQMGKNAKKFAHRVFDRKETYKKIIKVVEEKMDDYD